VDRVQWVRTFVAYMTAQGVTSEDGELKRLAEDLYATQGHLDPAVVGQAPHMRLPDGASGKADPGPGIGRSSV
jgi:hypothetical protein